MCKHRSSAEVHVGPLPVCYEVPSTGNHRMEKILLMTAQQISTDKYSMLTFLDPVPSGRNSSHGLGI